MSGDTRVDWSEAFALVPSLTAGYVWHAGVHAAEVAEGLRIIDVTDTALRMEMLICAALSAHIALAFDKAVERPSSVTHLAALRDALSGGWPSSTP